MRDKRNVKKLKKNKYPVDHNNDSGWRSGEEPRLGYVNGPWSSGLDGD
jgi:hypothetical protein